MKAADLPVGALDKVAVRKQVVALGLATHHVRAAGAREPAAALV